MAQSAPGASTLRRVPPWAAPIAALGVLLLLAILVIILANRTGGSGAPPRPGPFEAPSVGQAHVSYDVRQVGADGITVAPAGGGSTFTLDVAATVTVEALLPVDPGSIVPGDWIVVVAIPNEVRNFAITRLVVIGEPGEPGTDGFARSPGGFLGAEGSRGSAERAVMGGPVQSIDADGVVLEGPDGALHVIFHEGVPPVFSLDEVSAASIGSGDRLVVAAGTPLDEAMAIMVVPEALADAEEASLGP